MSYYDEPPFSLIEATAQIKMLNDRIDAIQVALDNLNAIARASGHRIVKKGFIDKLSAVRIGTLIASIACVIVASIGLYQSRIRIESLEARVVLLEACQ